MAPADVFIGQLIRKAREHLALAMDDVAEEIGIRSSKLNEFELGLERPNPEELLSLCAVLRVQPSWFFPEYVSNLGHERISPKVPDNVGTSDKISHVPRYELAPGHMLLIFKDETCLLINKNFDEMNLRSILKIIRP